MVGLQMLMGLALCIPCSPLVQRHSRDGRDFRHDARRETGEDSRWLFTSGAVEAGWLPGNSAQLINRWEDGNGQEDIRIRTRRREHATSAA